MSHKKDQVQIINAARGCGWTSRKNAEKYVGRGTADWCGTASIRFIEADLRSASVRVEAKKSSDFRDGDGFATLEQVRGIPLRPPELVFIGKRPTEPPREIIRGQVKVERSFLIGIPPAEAWPADLLGRYVDGRFERWQPTCASQ